VYLTLGEALARARGSEGATQRRSLYLACGFQPAHLISFLKAYVAERFPGTGALIETGLYGDLEGNLKKAEASEAESAIVLVEWGDLDPRLTLRGAGGWALSLHSDILSVVSARLKNLLAGLELLAGSKPVALIPPTLPLPPLGHTPSWQASRTELDLHLALSTFLRDAALLPNVFVGQSPWLAVESPAAGRMDALMELKAGFPYTTAHASAVAACAVRLLFPPAPKKGLISDLDDTLWAGIVGEVGVSGVTWSLAENTHVHAVYQQMLSHLHEMGVLLAIASKNEPAIVEEALARQDLLFPKGCFFPVHASWGPKSQAVAAILKSWNIGADSVVFVDDSPMELDEVAQAFPGITCLQFRRQQPSEVLRLVGQLRDLFGKPVVTREDSLRQASIRANAQIGSDVPSAEFVRGLQGKVTLSFRKQATNKRPLELINKTNQFNLNGTRLSEGEWMKHLSDAGSIVLSAEYEDKFGPLGTIGVLAGHRCPDGIVVSSWVLSCRAFSRQIEFHMLDTLFREHSSIRLAYNATERNQPLQRCLEALGLSSTGTPGELMITEEQFRRHIPDLPHQVHIEPND
jgi:FkbH-like protein